MKSIVTIISLLLSLSCIAQRIDTIQVSCQFTNSDTSYETITKCDTTYTTVTYDSVYYVWRWFVWKKKTKEADSIQQNINCHDEQYIVINNYTYDAWCDSLIYVSAKPPIRGLMTRQEDWIDTLPVNRDYFDNVKGFVIRINWSDLEPQKGYLNTSYIDNYIRFCEKIYNAYGIKLAIKLRIVTGVFSPQWVKNDVGYFKLTKGEWATELNNTCPLWWKDRFISSWSNLQKELALVYDNNEYLREVVMSATSAKTGEAMIRAVNEDGKDEYLNAGYTSVKDLASIYACIDAMSAWQLTNIGMSITPFVVINRNERVYEEINTTKTVLTYFANKFGKRATVGNNGLRTPDGHNGDNWATGGDMYNLCMAYIQASNNYGSNIFFQTASVDRQDSELTATLDRGLNPFKARCIELPQTQKKILENLTIQDLKKYKDLLNQ